jgi:short-subunit dehydrogenase
MSSWALVTGATSGIGESFTRLLASNKCNIVLVARDLPRLQERAQALEAKYGIKTHVIQADLATDEGCLKVEKYILENQIDVLINNAGFGTSKAFTMSTLEIEQQLLDVLVRTPMRLMHVALPPMKQRNQGIIINVSSVAGYIAATNVKVSALCPGFTRTEFHQRGKMSMKGLPNFLWLNSDRLVEQSWRDALKGKAVSVPGWQYKLLVFIVQTLVPRSIVRKVGMNMRTKQRK